jgi:hypothetical protein
MRKAVTCSWCGETFEEENFEDAKIILNRTGS